MPFTTQSSTVLPVCFSTFSATLLSTFPTALSKSPKPVLGALCVVFVRFELDPLVDVGGGEEPLPLPFDLVSISTEFSTLGFSLQQMRRKSIQSSWCYPTQAGRQPIDNRFRKNGC